MEDFINKAAYNTFFLDYETHNGFEFSEEEKADVDIKGLFDS